MNSLEKQLKKGYYVIHIGYETVIEQSILKGISHQNEIPTFSRQLAQEYSPGKNFLMYLAGLQIVKRLTYTSSGALLQDHRKLRLLDDEEEKIPDPVIDPMVAFYRYFKGYLRSDHAPAAAPENPVRNLKALFQSPISIVYELTRFLTQFLPSELIQRFLEDMLYFGIFVSEFKSNPLKIICGEVILPLWMAKILNMTLARRIDEKMSDKTWYSLTFDMILKHMKNGYSGVLLGVFSKMGFKTMKPNTLLFDGIFKDMVSLFEKHYVSLRGSIILYPTIVLGVFILQHVICRKVAKNIMTLEIRSTEFNKVLKALVYYLNDKKKQKNYFKIKSEYEDVKSASTIPVSVMAIKVYNKVYTDSNDVANQIPLLVKDLLKNLPQNVFVRKVEYFGFEEDDALARINSTDFMSDESDGGKNQIIKGKASNSSERGEDAFDVVQTLYSTVPKEIDFQNHRLTSVDEAIIKYVKQHYALYRFINRKTLSRRFLLNVISDRMKPLALSPMIPHAYEIHFMNTTNDPLKLYFYNETKPWFKHLRTIKAPLEEREKRNSVLNDIYVVRLSVQQFVAKNMQNVVNDIPDGLSILEVYKPADGRDQSCSKYRIFPRTRSVCQLPPREHSVMDDRFVEAVINRKGVVDGKK